MEKKQKVSLIAAITLLFIFGLAFLNNIDFNRSDNTAASIVPTTKGTTNGTVHVFAGDDFTTTSKKFTLNGVAESSAGADLKYIWVIAEKPANFTWDGTRELTNTVTTRADGKYVLGLKASNVNDPNRDYAIDYITVWVNSDGNTTPDPTPDPSTEDPGDTNQNPLPPDPETGGTIDPSDGTKNGTVHVFAGDDFTTTSKKFTLNGVAESSTGADLKYIWVIAEKPANFTWDGTRELTNTVTTRADGKYVFGLKASNVNDPNRDFAIDYITVWVNSDGNTTQDPTPDPEPEDPGDTTTDPPIDTTAKEPTVSASINPESIELRESATITWSSTNTTSCTGTGFDTRNSTSGTATVTPYTASSQTYTVTCSSSSGQTVKTSIYLEVFPSPPSGELSMTASISPTSIYLGEKATITWSAQNAGKCIVSSSVMGFTERLDTGEKTSGSVIVEPGFDSKHTYSILCYSPDMSQNVRQILYLDVATQLIDYPDAVLASASLDLSTPTIISGQSARLTWSSEYTSSCVGTNFSTENMTSGSITVSPKTTTTYTLKCPSTIDLSVPIRSRTLTVVSGEATGACSYPEGKYNEFALSDITKISSGSYDIKTGMPTYKILKEDGSFAYNFAYPIGSWKGKPLFIGYGYSFIETNDGTRYPIIAMWTDLTNPLENGHSQRVFAVDMPMSEVEPYVLPLLTFNNTDPAFRASEDNMLLGDMQNSGNLLGSLVIWRDILAGSEYPEIGYIYRGEDNTYVYYGDSFEPAFYVEDGKIIGIMGYVYKSNSNRMITTSPWLVRRLVSMINGTTWTERSITHGDTGRCLPLAPLPDFSTLKKPQVSIKNSVLYNELMSN